MSTVLECAHYSAMIIYTGDGTEVEYCPDCGRNKTTGRSCYYPQYDKKDIEPVNQVSDTDYDYKVVQLDTDTKLINETITESLTEQVAKSIMTGLWKQEQYNGVGSDYETYRVSMGDRVGNYEKRALEMAKDVMSVIDPYLLDISDLLTCTTTDIAE
jgi:hypothetical protein